MILVYLTRATGLSVLRVVMLLLRIESSMRKNFISRAFPDIDTFLNLHIDTILNLYLNTYYTPLYLLVFARSHLAFTFYLV